MPNHEEEKLKQLIRKLSNDLATIYGGRVAFCLSYAAPSVGKVGYLINCKKLLAAAVTHETIARLKEDIQTEAENEEEKDHV